MKAQHYNPKFWKANDWQIVIPKSEFGRKTRSKWIRSLFPVNPPVRKPYVYKVIGGWGVRIVLNGLPKCKPTRIEIRKGLQSLILYYWSTWIGERITATEYVIRFVEKFKVTNRSTQANVPAVVRKELFELFPDLPIEH